MIEIHRWLIFAGNVCSIPGVIYFNNDEWLMYPFIHSIAEMFLLIRYGLLLNEFFLFFFREIMRLSYEDAAHLVIFKWEITEENVEKRKKRTEFLVIHMKRIQF